VKPENILFFGGSPCLGDISLLGEDATVITRRGTPGYATPTWYQGGHPDMYAVAATLYTLLTGNPPDRMGKSSFLWPPQGEASLSESERKEWKRLHAMIRRATEEKVGERYLDFRAMAAAISSAEEQASLPMPHPPLPAKLTQPAPAKTTRVLWVLAVLALIVIGFGAKGFLFPKSTESPKPAPHPKIASEETPSNPLPTKARKPKIVDSQGHFKSLRERVIDTIPAAISVAPSDDKPRLDLRDYADRSAILKAYEARDYSRCLDLTNARINNQPALLENPLCFLFKALLFMQLDRDSDMQAALKEFRRLPNVRAESATLSMSLTLLEALELPGEAEKLASAAIEASHAELLRDGQQAHRQDVQAVMLLHRDRARARILMGDMAGALADELAALALPPGISAGGRPESAEEAQQLHLNTIVMEWELLEQELPAYAEYLEANGNPEPKPDHRNLRAVD
jgi:hypothetical protein